MPTKVFAGSLPEGTDAKQINDLFSAYGEISDTNVIKNFAFIHFVKEEDAAKAVKDLHRSTLSGSTINVELSKNKKSDSKGRSEGGCSDDRQSQRRDDQRDRSSSRRRSRSRDRGSRRSNRDALGGILPTPNPLGALAGLPGLGAIPGVQPQIQHPQIQHAPQQEQERPNPDVRVRKEAVHVSFVPGAMAMGLTDGFVIYERYYVDPNHHLLQEPRIEDTRVEDTFVTPKVYDSYVAPREAPLFAPTARQALSRQESYVPPPRQFAYPPQKDSFAPLKQNSYASPRKESSAPFSRQDHYDPVAGKDPISLSRQDSYSPASSQRDAPLRDAAPKSHNPYRTITGQQVTNPYREQVSSRPQAPIRQQDQYSKKRKQNSQQDNQQASRPNNQPQFDDDPYAALSAQGAMYNNYGNINRSADNEYTVSYK